MHQLKRALACTLMLISTNSISAANWTNYQGNAAHTGYVQVKTNPANIQKLWQLTYRLSHDGASLPANWFQIGGVIIVDNTAFLTMQEYYFVAPGSSEMYSVAALLAIDLNSGQVKWQQSLGKHHQANAPVYDNGRVFIMDYNGNTDSFQMIAYLADSGKEDYRMPIQGTGMFGPTAANGNIYTTWKTLDSINALSGKLNWSVPVKVDLQLPSIAAISDKYIIRNGMSDINIADVNSGQSLYQISAGDASWYQGIITTPVFDAAHNAAYQNFRTDDGMTTFAFDLNTHQVKWKGVGSLSQVTFAGNEIYAIGSDKAKKIKRDDNPLELQARDALSGAITWRWHLTGKEFFNYGNQTLVATDDVIFVPLRSSTVAISRTSHNKVWETSEHGDAIVGNHTLLIFGWDNSGIKVSGYTLG